MRSSAIRSDCPGFASLLIPSDLRALRGLPTVASERRWVGSLGANRIGPDWSRNPHPPWRQSQRGRELANSANTITAICQRACIPGCPGFCKIHIQNQSVPAFSPLGFPLPNHGHWPAGVWLPRVVKGETFHTPRFQSHPNTIQIQSHLHPPDFATSCKNLVTSGSLSSFSSRQNDKNSRFCHHRCSCTQVFTEAREGNEGRG